MAEDNQDDIMKFDDEEQKEDEQQQQVANNQQNEIEPSPQTDNKEEQIAQYDENYNQQQQLIDQPIDEQKPQEIEQKPINVIQEGEEGFFSKMKCCRSHQPVQEQTEGDSACSVVLRELDNFIQKLLTPLYLLILYYAVFVTLTLYCLKLIFIDKEPYYAEILGGLYIFTLLLKGLLIYILSDEWFDELPYLDSRFENGLRTTQIIIMIATNLDIIVWVFYIYGRNKRDGAIEHMMALCRMVDAFFQNFPLMILFLYLQIKDIDNLNIIYIILSGLNMLQIVNAFMHLNFFGGSSFLSIRWTLLFLCDLYVKSLLVVSVYCKLIEYHIHYGYFGLFALFGLIQFYLLSDDQDTFGKIMSILYFQFKTFFVIIFKEESLGMQELDCDAQPGIFNVLIQKKSFTYVQKSFNLLQIISLGFVYWLFGGMQDLENHSLQKNLFIAGLSCFGISFLHLLFSSLSVWKSNMVKNNLQKQ